MSYVICCDMIGLMQTTSLTLNRILEVISEGPTVPERIAGELKADESLVAAKVDFLRTVGYISGPPRLGARCNLVALTPNGRRYLEQH